MTEPAIAILDDERLIRDGEAAVGHYNASRASARTQIMPMALGLLAAKRKYPATQEFGEWLDRSPYCGINDPDRAALIKIGDHDEFASRFIRATHYVSPRSIWDAMEGLMPTLQVVNSTSNSAPTPEQAPVIIQTVQSEEPAQPQAPENHSEPPPRVRSSGGGSSTRRTVLESVPRGQELHALFQHNRTRTTLGGLARKQFWALILTALDAGLIRRNNYATVEASALLLFPEGPAALPRRFPVRTRLERAHVRDVLLPALIACKDELLASPSLAMETLDRHWTAQRAQAAQVTVNQQREVALGTLEPGQQELVMFGQTVWPRLDNRQGSYTYDQIRAAIWTFRDYEGWNKMLARDNNVQSHGIRIRNSLRYLTEYMIRTRQRTHDMAVIFGLIGWMSKLMEQAPEGECKWPMYPHRECEW